MSTPSLQEAIDAVHDIQKRLSSMAKCEPFSGDRLAKDALERAASWLGNITNPITEGEHSRWFKDVGENDAQLLCDDEAETLNFIDQNTTDEDKRKDIKDFVNYNKENDNANNK